MFVTKEQVPVTIDGKNVIYIRAKLGKAAKGRVQDAALHVNNPEALAESGATAQEVSLTLGAFNTALLHEYIVRWEGPAFGDTLCIPANIDQLDDDEPLVEKVLEEIVARYNAKKPMASETSG